MHVSEMMQMTREVADLFDEQVGPWSVPVMLTELMAEVGTLADSLMIQEGYRRPRADVPDLSDDVADILFMLLRIADAYHIEIASAYKEMIQRTRERLVHQRSSGAGLS